MDCDLGYVNQINPLLPKLLLVMGFITAIVTLRNLASVLGFDMHVHV